MTHEPGDVGQSLGLPDFVEPSDVVEASFDASARWGEDSRPGAAERSDAASGGPLAGDPRPRRGSRSRGFGSPGGPSSSGATALDGSSRGRGAASRTTGGKNRAKKHVTWQEKQLRKEQRAEKRAAEERAERERDPMGFAREIVLRQLTAAPRSRGQLAEKLRAKHVEEEVIDAVLDRMEDVGLVDDDAYAGMLVRSQVASRGLARRALKQELVRKGVEEETALAALEQVSDDDERARALELVEKKLRTMRGVSDEARTRRLAGLLARKGYPASIVWSVIREAQGAAGEDEVVEH